MHIERSQSGCVLLGVEGKEVPSEDVSSRNAYPSGRGAVIRYAPSLLAGFPSAQKALSTRK